MLKLMISRYENDSCITDLGKAWAFSGSEAKSYNCPRFYSYYYVENIREYKEINAASLGTAFHLYIEKLLTIVKNDDRLLLKVDSDNCLLDIEPEIYQMTKEALNDSSLAQIKCDEIIDKIRNASEGIRRYWNEMLKDYKVLALEENLRCPIFIDEKFTSIFSPEMDLLRKIEGKYITFKPPKTGESLSPPEGWTHVKKSWPWYRIGKADLILQNRHDNSIVISDHKTSANPTKYARNIDYQTQLASYSALLSWEMDSGKFQNWGKDWDIRLGQWNVFHSKVPGKPSLLKSGKLSTAKNRFYQSWVFEKSIIDNGLNVEDYQDHIDWLKQEADHKYSIRCDYEINANKIARSIIENSVYANDIARTRNALSNIQNDDIFKFSQIAVRRPQCIHYGSCLFTNNCLSNNTPSVIIGEEEILPKIYWTNKIEV